MQERVHEIGGTLKVFSFPAKGTQIEVKVPIMIERGEKYDKSIACRRS